MFAMSALQQTNPNEGLGWVWLLIIGVLLVIVLWWLSNRQKVSQTEVLPEMPVRVQEKTSDDLTKIEGIGPKVAKVLNGAGITTFEMLAHAEAADVQKTLNAAGLQMLNPEGWIEQASLAAKRDWNELERLQGELKGGRRK